MAIHAAANIARAVENFKNRVMRNLAAHFKPQDVPREAEKVAELADDFHTAVIGTLSHSEQVALAEEQGMTLMECYPDSAMAGEYRALAKQMYMICGGILPENAKSDMTKKKDTAEVQSGYEKNEAVSQKNQSENTVDTVVQEEN